MVRNLFLGLGLVLVASHPVAAQPRIALADLGELSPSADKPLEVTCGDAAHRGSVWTKDKATAGRFKINRSGSIELDESAPSGTIQFIGAKSAIAVLDDAKSVEAGTHLACGWVSEGVYTMPSGSTKGAMLSLRLFAEAKLEPDHRFFTYRRDKLAEAQKHEREKLHAEAAVRAFVISARTSLVARTDASAELALAGYTALHTRVEQIRSRFGCALEAPIGLLSPAVCEEAFAVEQIAKAIEITIADSRGKSDEVRARELKAAKLDEMIAKLQADEPPRVVHEDHQCKAIAELRWLYIEDMPRLVNRSQIPTTDVVFAGAYGKKTKPKTDIVPRSRSFAFVVTGVPVETKTAFREREGKRISLDTTAMLSAIITNGWPARFPPIRTKRPGDLEQLEHLENQWADARRQKEQGLDKLREQELVVSDLKKQLDMLGAGKANSGLQAELLASRGDLSKLRADVETSTKRLGVLEAQFRDAVEKLVEADRRVEPTPIMHLASPSLICPEPRPDHPEVEIRVDPGLAPVDGIENLARRFESVSSDHETSMALCTGECGATADDKTDKAVLSIVPSSRFSFTLLAELGAGVALEGGTFAGLSEPSFEAVGGNEGPDQIFELTRAADPRNVISTSLLLAYRLPHRLVLGLGPTLLVGTSGAVFQQWNARAGVKIAKGVYLTTGPSVRAVKTPDDYKIGDRVSVMRPASGPATAPDFAKHYEAVWEWQVGFSFDLGEVGGVTSDIYKALGGK